jgi:pimeloyl-ACP methyl ester carboxylesterase
VLRNVSQNGGLPCRILYGAKLRDRSSHRLVWLNARALLHPDATMEALRLDPSGSDRLESSGILDEVAILPPFLEPAIYKRLRAFLRHNLHLPASHRREFHYDWRKPMRLAVAQLEAQIERWRAEAGASRVNLVAHSYGGMVARAYLEEFGSAAVNWLITFGTPHKGMLKTFETAYSGLQIFTFTPAMTRRTARTLPSAYELLPQDPADDLFRWNGAAASAVDTEEWIETTPGDQADRSGMRQLLRTARSAVTGSLAPSLPVRSCLIYGTRHQTTLRAQGTVGGSVGFEVGDGGDGTVPATSAMGNGLSGSSVFRYPIPFGHHMLLFDDPKVLDLLTELVLRDRLPTAPHFVVRLRREPIVVPRSTNRLVVELRDNDGQPLTDSEVRLTIEGTTIRDRLVPATLRGDYLLDVRMPKPGTQTHYVVTARTPSVVEAMVHRAALVAA